MQRIDAGSAEILLRVAALEEEREFAAFLTPAETAQAARMVNPALRTRFIVSRGLRRQMLADCLRVPGHDLAFREDNAAGSKPALVDHAGWDFNLSHAGNHVAVAVRRGPVGVDLEQHRAVRDMAAIVRRYFHPDEALAWRKLPKDRREDGFFRLWSAREAAMKCAGLGLAKGLAITRVDPLLLSEPEAPVRVGDRSLMIRMLEAPRGYTLSLGWSTAQP